jgi:nucleoside triphosphate pyrophosphatase
LIHSDQWLKLQLVQAAHSSAGQNPLVLASSSPRRQELLTLAGVSFQQVTTATEEQRATHETAEEFCLRVAHQKAHSAARTCPGDRWVLGADTIVVIDHQVLGKPADEHEAAAMLRRLSGRDHLVLTAVVLLHVGSGREQSFTVRTTVTFRRLSNEWIDGYIRTGEPLDKAGAYGIQGRGAMLVSRISGSYTNVVGLPLGETVALLEQAGIFRPFAAA